MTSGRLEAFSDGVLAIIITIMVIALDAPKEATLIALIESFPIFISYLVSFVYVGVYWNRHHNLFKLAEKINVKTLWINLHLLFWLSLIPFTTDWIGENHISKFPVRLYGLVLIMCEISFLILKSNIVKLHGKSSSVGLYLKSTRKDILSLSLYGGGLFLAFLNIYLALAMFLIVGFYKVFELNYYSKNDF